MPSSGTIDPAWYPVALDLAGKRVLMVGAGSVAARKLTRLIRTSAEITMVSSAFSSEVEAILEEFPGRVTRIAAPFDETQLEAAQPHLVFACTDNAILNREISQCCEKRNIWVNCVTDGLENSDFIVPSLIEALPLQIALFSGGASPMLLRRLRETFEEQLGSWLPGYLLLLKTLRQDIQDCVTDEAQRRLMNEALLNDTILIEAFQTGNAVSDQLRAEVWGRLEKSFALRHISPK